MAQAPGHQAESHYAIADDHHCREYGVAGQGARRGATGKHHRDDQGRLDDCDSERQDQCAERLTDPQRDHFGVVYGDEHGGNQRDAGA